MTPDQFMAALGAHFSNRHDSEAAASIWYEDMVSNIKGYGSSVLAAVARDIIQTRKMRSFPLLAEIREAADKHTPVSQPTGIQYGPSKRRPDTFEELERYRLAAEWQQSVCAKYGTMDAYLKATVRLRDDGTQRAGHASKRSSFQSLSAASRRMTGEHVE